MPTNPKLFPTGAVVAIGTMLVLLVGCAEERATGPGEVASLPSMDLTDDPIEAVTNPMWPEETFYWGESVFRITDSMRASIGRVDDLLFDYSLGTCGPQVLVFDNRLTAWRQIVFGGLYPCMIAGGHYTWFMSMFDASAPDVLADSDGRVRFLAKGAYLLVLRLVRYRENYRWISAPTDVPFLPGPIACIDRQVWVATRNWSGAEPDSIHVFNWAGTRESVWSIGETAIHSMVAFADQVWAVIDRPHVIATLAPGGRIDVQFPLNLSFNERTTRLTATEHHLWVLDPDRHELLGILPTVSADSGYPVIDQRIPIPAERINSPSQRAGLRGLTAVGESFYINGKDSVYQIDMSGGVEAVYPLRVMPTSNMAWDGETIWMNHTRVTYRSPAGPNYTRPTVVSRFHLPATSP